MMRLTAGYLLGKLPWVMAVLVLCWGLYWGIGQAKQRELSQPTSPVRAAR